MLYIGVDTGGTFTDFVVFDEQTNQLRVHKVPSTPSDPTQAFMQGLGEMELDLRDVRMIVHGTTIATNAVVERKGAKTAVLVTKGHRDVIEYGQLRRYSEQGLWNIRWQRPEPYVPRRFRYEVNERVLYTGEVLNELQDEDVKSIVEKMKAEGIESTAVCFVNSYANADHEHRAAALIRQYLPGVPVSESAQVVPEFREFERWATTILNAYVEVLVGSYLKKLGRLLRCRGYQGELFYMTSSGSILTEASAADYPVRFLLSGPAAGVSAGIYLGEAVGVKDIITYDMGGTSTDVSLTRNLKPVITRERLFAGVPIKTPQLDIITIGTGGGSIAWVDENRSLKVGPQSAGADPGPASYGKGGSQATVTDASLLLGYLAVETPLAGNLRLSKELAEKAITSLSRQAEMSDQNRLAAGIIEISVNNMAGAIRTLSIERGLDPRDFALFPIGGAGPMYACPIAEELGADKVLVSNHPGNACAFGLLTTDLQHHYARTYVTELQEADLSVIRSLLKEMGEEGRAALTKEGLPERQVHIACSADMRYVGQSYQLEVPVDLKSDLQDLERDFHDIYYQAYGYSRKEMTIEIVYLRAVASGTFDKPALRSDGTRGGHACEALEEERAAYFRGAFVDCPVYHRGRLGPGRSLDGPAVIEEYGSTTVIFPGWKASVDPYANLILERAGG